MKVKLFQVAPEKDCHNLMFMNYEFTMAHGGIREDTYEVVFDGELEVKRLEDIFRIFNIAHPEGFRGRSMSVSDVVWAEGLGAFFCDSIGFKPVTFDQSKCPWRDFNEHA